MKRTVFIILAVFFAGAFSFTTNAQCPTSCSTVLTDCYEPIGGGCPSASCSGSIKVSNFGWSQSGSTISLTQLAMCYFPSATPPWTSTLVAGRLMTVSLRPSGTRTFNTTASNGATFQCTVESSGLWSVKLISGTAPGRGTSLTGGSYTL